MQNKVLERGDAPGLASGGGLVKAVSLFSGIGGLDAAVESAFGATVTLHVEQDAHCRKVLARHFPGVRCIEDVRAVTADDVAGADIIFGGFPCTDLSVAGNGEGMHAARSGLWWEFLRLVLAAQPGLVLVENVPPLYRKPEWRRCVEGPLTAAGYRCEWVLLTAADAGAPHRRERCFMLAVAGPVFAVAPIPITGPANPTWPTPTATRRGDCPSERARRTPGLMSAVSWPTPTARLGDARGAPGPDLAVARFAEGRRNLDDAVALPWATPCARDYRSDKGRADNNGHTPQLPHMAGGILHPSWVEPLMGLPIGWTASTGERMAVLPAPLWPAGRGAPQHEWEAPRVAPSRSIPERCARLKALGNAVVPQQAMLAIARLVAQHRAGGTPRQAELFALEAA